MTPVCVHDVIQVSQSRGTGMTSYTATGKTTKLAWKRDQSVPAGQPALGRFDCVCGHTIQGVEFGGPDSTCQCGRVWDGRGWLVSEPQSLSGTGTGTDISGEVFPLVIDQADIDAPHFPRSAEWWQGFVPANWITVEVRSDGTVAMDAQRERGCPHDNGTPPETPLTEAQFRRRRASMVRWIDGAIGPHLKGEQ